MMVTDRSIRVERTGQAAGERNEGSNSSDGGGGTIATAPITAAAAATTTAIAAVRRPRHIYYNSKAFRLLERLFNASQPLQHAKISGSERATARRLVKAGLVSETRDKDAHDCCSITHVRYSLTSAGRAYYVATELGISFPQLCYLACARAVMHNPFFADLPAFIAKDVHSIFGMVFRDLSPSVTRRLLTQKGFLVGYVWHVSSTAPRFAELDRYAAVLEETYQWTKREYNARFAEAVQDKVIAKIVGLALPVAQRERSQ